MRRPEISAYFEQWWIMKFDKILWCAQTCLLQTACKVWHVHAWDVLWVFVIGTYFRYGSEFKPKALCLVHSGIYNAPGFQVHSEDQVCAPKIWAWLPGRRSEEPFTYPRSCQDLPCITVWSPLVLAIWHAWLRQRPGSIGTYLELGT